jgi:hypothetical protein
MAQKRPHSSHQTSSTDIFQSDPIHDRASTFIALFSPTIPAKTLQNHRAISAASHRIAAWRLPSRQLTLGGKPPRFDVGHDDDGEKGAGIRLGRLLEADGIVGNLAVGRWWGGVMLGPSRFTWIEQSAKEAIMKWAMGQVASELPTKKVKTLQAAQIGVSGTAVSAAPKPVQAEAHSRGELIDELERRDRNIGVLRDLLKEKKDKLEGTTSPQASPAKVVDYKTMPMSRLLALDRVRDATLTYILKQLDKVDQEQKEEDELDAAFEQVAKQEEQRKNEEAFAEMENIAKEEEDQEAFAEMERIARELENDANEKELDQQPKSPQGPKTPERAI